MNYHPDSLWHGYRWNKSWFRRLKRIKRDWAIKVIWIFLQRGCIKSQTTTKTKASQITKLACLHSFFFCLFFVVIFFCGYFPYTILVGQRHTNQNVTELKAADLALCLQPAPRFSFLLKTDTFSGPLQDQKETKSIVWTSKMKIKKTKKAEPTMASVLSQTFDDIIKNSLPKWCDLHLFF